MAYCFYICNNKECPSYGWKFMAVYVENPEHECLACGQFMIHGS